MRTKSHRRPAIASKSRCWPRSRHVLFEEDGGLVPKPSETKESIPQLKFSNEWKLKLRAMSNVISGNQKLFTQIAWSAVRFDESETCGSSAKTLNPKP